MKPRGLLEYVYVDAGLCEYVLSFTCQGLVLSCE